MTSVDRKFAANQYYDKSEQYFLGLIEERIWACWEHARLQLVRRAGQMELIVR